MCGERLLDGDRWIMTVIIMTLNKPKVMRITCCSRKLKKEVVPMAGC